MRARILSISYDRALLSVRQHLLELEGYEVVSVFGFDKAVEQIRAGRFDLVILGHSIPLTEKDDLLKIIVENGSAPVIALFRSGEPPLANVQASIDPFQPAKLLAAVAQLLKATNPSDPKGQSG